MEKTNVMRILDQKKIAYTPHAYPLHADGAAPGGTEIAAFLQKPCAAVYKTLVTRGASGRLYVFDIPVDGELDLKKAARAVSEKSVEMLKSKELLPNTGYIHGGCSPIGMKKPYPVIFEAAVMDLSTVTFSAGRVGFQVELNTADLGRALAFSTANLLA